jgi:hypothetical protein
VIASLIRRTLVPGKAYAAIDIDNPGARALAVAWLADDGWRVGVDGGRTVATQLTKTRALNVMDQTAGHRACHPATRALLTEMSR